MFSLEPDKMKPRPGFGPLASSLTYILLFARSGCLSRHFWLHEKIFKKQVPGDLTLVDLQAPLGHVSHPLLALLAAVHGQVVDVRSFVCHLKVTDAAVPLRRVRDEGMNKRWCMRAADCFTISAHLSTEVDDAGIWVKEGQQDAAAGVQLLQSQWLLEVLLLGENKMTSSVNIVYKVPADCR